jgi:hypothetical protein
MIFDQTGVLANVKRHDYAPFGEELFNGARSPAMGYGAVDSTHQSRRQKAVSLLARSLIRPVQLIAFDSEDAIQARAVILKRNLRCQLQ